MSPQPRFLAPVIGATVTVLLAGCVTAPAKPEYQESRVLERVGGKDETPEWADGTHSMEEAGADVIFVAQTTMGGNSRTEACVKAAELDGRASMLRYVKENISASGQVNETDAASDPGYESLTAFLSSGKLSGIKTTAKYWEKVEQSDEGGDRVLKVRCVVKLAIKKSDLQRQLREATAASGGNPKVHDALINAQSQFFENLGGGKQAH